MIGRALGCAALTLLLGSSLGNAAIDHYAFEDDSLRQRYLQLVKELRCPKCQNQNIADSNAPISNDLRQQVYLQLKQGKSDSEITRYMVKRYGQFIVYRPPISAETLILWLAPLAFVVIGLACVIAMARRSGRVEAVSGDGDREQRLKQLLEDEESV